MIRRLYRILTLLSLTLFILAVVAHILCPLGFSKILWDHNLSVGDSGFGLMWMLGPYDTPYTNSGAPRYFDWQFIDGIMVYSWSDCSHPGGELEISVEYWFIALLTSILPTLAFMAYLAKRYRRIPPNLCPQCSYDLRAHHPGQLCPECGTPIPHPTHPTR